MQTIQQLRSGELRGSKILKLSYELTEFPKEIFELKDTLEILDLSNNQLTHLPDNFGDFKKLKIAFFSENKFSEFPEVLSQCPNLTMIGFKSNQINYISEQTFPEHLQWLILTNNYINYIPKSIGKCSKLQKVALAGNQLKELPIEMANCKNLELLRVSANQFNQFPEWLFSLPRLSWLAFSGNPFCEKISLNKELPIISWQQLEIKETLGEGASGVISKATWNDSQNNKNIAIKVFKGEVTSDGFPEDEMNACIAAGKHENLVTVIGKLKDHPQQKMGLLLELIPPHYKNLAGPPSFDTCTRDTFKPGTHFTSESILKISQSIADIVKHLHSKGIMHGDLYAHNTLIDDDSNTIFGDFGAATYYDTQHKNAVLFEKLDVRAFGCLMEDLLNLVSENEKREPLFVNLLSLKNSCLKEGFADRPSFKEIQEMLLVLN